MKIKLMSYDIYLVGTYLPIVFVQISYTLFFLLLLLLFEPTSLWELKFPIPNFAFGTLGKTIQKFKI